jgi:hypothetical protein
MVTTCRVCLLLDSIDLTDVTLLSMFAVDNERTSKRSVYRRLLSFLALLPCRLTLKQPKMFHIWN